MASGKSSHRLRKPASAPKKQRQRSFFLRFFLSKRFIGTMFFLFFAVAMYFFVLKDFPSATTLGNNTFPQSTKIYDRNGKLLYTIYAAKNRSFVPLSKIPKHLQYATISIEDRDFYKHGAIDIRGIARAFYFTIFKQQVQ